MNGRSRILVGEITQDTKLRGKAFAEKLAKDLNQDEKGSTYQNTQINHEKSTERKNSK